MLEGSIELFAWFPFTLYRRSFCSHSCSPILFLEMAPCFRLSGAAGFIDPYTTSSFPSNGRSTCGSRSISISGSRLAWIMEITQWPNAGRGRRRDVGISTVSRQVRDGKRVNILTQWILSSCDSSPPTTAISQQKIQFRRPSALPVFHPHWYLKCTQENWRPEDACPWLRNLQRDRHRHHH